MVQLGGWADSWDRGAGRGWTGQGELPLKGTLSAPPCLATCKPPLARPIEALALGPQAASHCQGAPPDASSSTACVGHGEAWASSQLQGQPARQRPALEGGEAAVPEELAVLFLEHRGARGQGTSKAGWGCKRPSRSGSSLGSPAG